MPHPRLRVVTGHSGHIKVAAALPPRKKRKVDSTASMPTLPTRADILVSELLDSDFLAEVTAHPRNEIALICPHTQGVLPAVRDAWDRLLVPDAIVVPQRAMVWAQLVHVRARAPSADWCAGDLLERAMGGVSECRAVPRPRRVHWSGVMRRGDAVALSAPFQAFEFDFSSQSSLPPSTGRCRKCACGEGGGWVRRGDS